MRSVLTVIAASAAFVAGVAHAQSESIVERMRAQAEALEPLASSDLTRAFLRSTQRLPMPDARVLHIDPARRRYLAPDAWAALAPAEQRAYKRTTMPADRYYTTKYGTPLAYVRAFEYAAEAGLDAFAGKRVLDFGYGTIGHLRLIAQLGADAVGVDVDPFLTALYSASTDQGTVANAGGTDGRVTLVDGRWPADEKTVERVGDGYDLVLSKNTLKRGYIHPAKKVDPRMLVQLGVDDARFVAAVARILRPGGLFVIYNLSPKQNPPEERYLPWADGRCPFDRDAFERAGLEIVHFDTDDGDKARAMGEAFGWPEKMGDLKETLFATVTVARKPK